MVAALDFVVPAHLEARAPAEARGLARDGVRLLVTDVATGRSADRQFADLADVLRPGDLLVVNDSATLPAALDARRSSGETLALHLSTHVASTLWIVEPRGAASPGERLELPARASATLLAPVQPDAERLWYARLDVSEPVVEYLHAHGRPIRYTYVEHAYPIEAYQTIFARVPGSAEMPSAARPFTLATLDSLRRKGIGIATITLHCGVASAESHEPPQSEAFTVPTATVDAVRRTQRAGGRIIAIGTTVVRALESAATLDGELVASAGWTGLVIDRSRPLRVADGILTGFHEPRASHLDMLRAFAPDRVLDDAYAQALEGGYLWHEFGDVHLIVR